MQSLPKVELKHSSSGCTCQKHTSAALDSFACNALPPKSARCYRSNAGLLGLAANTMQQLQGIIHMQLHVNKARQYFL
jgi:hypothetical protein